MLDVHPLSVHDLLDDIGSHLVLVFRVFMAVPASIFLRLLALGAAGILRQLFLIDSQLQCIHGGTGDPGRPPSFRFPTPSKGGSLTLACPMYLAELHGARGSKHISSSKQLVKSFPSLEFLKGSIKMMTKNRICTNSEFGRNHLAAPQRQL